MSLFLSDVNISTIIDDVVTNVKLYRNADLVVLKIPKNYNLQDLQQKDSTRRYTKITFPKFDVVMFDVLDYRRFSCNYISTKWNLHLATLFNNGDKRSLISVISKVLKPKYSNYQWIHDWLQYQLSMKRLDREIYTALRKFARSTPKIDNRGKNRAKDVYQISRTEPKMFSKISRDYKYIDFGGGDGAITNALREQLDLTTDQAICLDIDTWFDNKVEKKFPVSYRTAQESGQLEFKDEEFDFITAFQSLHHIVDIDLKLSELARITRKGGYLLIREHDMDCQHTKMLIDIEHFLYEMTLKPKPNENFIDSYDAWYKSKYQWTNSLSRFGYVYCRNVRYPNTKRCKNPTKYYYALYKKK